MEERVELISRDESQLDSDYYGMHYRPPVHYEEVVVDGELASWMGVLQYDMRIGSAVVREGGIISVGTKENYRMRGYYRSCLTRSMRYIHDQGCDISLIYAAPNLYWRYGYETCLPVHTVTLRVQDAEEAQRRSEYEVRDYRETDIDAVLRIFNEHNRRRTCTLVRNKGEWAGFPPGRRPGFPPSAFLLEKDGEAVAYVSFHRLRDPDRVRYFEEFLVTEVGVLDHRCFGTILNELAVRATQGRFEHVAMDIPLDHPLTEYCHRFGCESAIRYPKNELGIMRIVNQRTLFQKLERELQQRVDESGVVEGHVEVKTELGSTRFDVEDGELRVGEGGGTAQNRAELPVGALTQLVVGYRSVADAVNDERVSTEGDLGLLEALFPASFPYMWAYDRY
jgi:predicted acetyltransferase